MRRTIIQRVALCLLLSGFAEALAGQTTETSLGDVSGRVEDYIRETKRDWKHETTPPPSPPGVAPSPDVVIHFWSSEKCLTAELKIDGVGRGAQSVPCRVKLAIDVSPTAAEARARLSDFTHNQFGESVTPLEIGDKGYVRKDASVVFVKGRFTFRLSGVVDLRVGDFSIDREFIESPAKEIEKSVAAP